MYNVVFRNTEKGFYPGLVTWCSYQDKTDFDAKFTPEMREAQEVIAENVPKENCIRLVGTTTLAARVQAALKQATDEKTGKVDDERFRRTLSEAIAAYNHNCFRYTHLAD
jgi:hypothetical protein